MKIEENEVYTTKEVAQILKVSLPTIKRMLKDKRLPSTRIGKQHRFLGRDLIALLDSKEDLRYVVAKKPAPPAAPVVSAPAPVPPAPPPAITAPRREPTAHESVSTAEFRQRAYMIGKTLLRDLFDHEGNLLFEQGCIVTEEMIETAKKSRKLMELFSNIEHED
jgi:excisionase family DNA binding protein